MSFLTPIFLVGLAALAVPVLVHLIQRERRSIVEFPSLMFLRRIPYQSVRRRRVRHWWLLLVRLAALALIVLAFGRPFFAQGGLASTVGGNREVVLLLDTSYSMDAAGRWARVQALAREVVETLSPGDRASLVLFASEPEVAVRSSPDPSTLLPIIEATRPTAGATRYAPALKLAGSILTASSSSRREAVLISDFQRGGWKDAGNLRFADGVMLTAVPVEAAVPSTNVSVTPVALQRSTFSDQERVIVTAGAVNRGDTAVRNLDVVLEVDGRAIETAHLDLEPGGSGSVTFAPLTVAARDMRGSVRVGDVAGLPADNVFHFVVSPTEPLRVLVVDGDGADRSLYVTKALEISELPRFQVTARRAATLRPGDLREARVVILNDVVVSAGLASSLTRFVDDGGGLFVGLGPHATWPAGHAGLLPCLVEGVVDRSSARASRLAAIDFGHPVFELFRAPHSGDLSAVRFYGHRTVRLIGGPEAAGRPAAPGDAVEAAVLSRFDDGAPALVEARAGKGRVMVWTSSLDLSWTDLVLKPIFLPFIHRVSRYLAGYVEPAPWLTVGQVVRPLPAVASGGTSARRLALTPSGRRVEFGGGGADLLTLAEQGFYEVRPRTAGEGATLTVASNVDLTESDATPIDPRAVVAAVTGAPGGADRSPGAESAGPAAVEDRERVQHIWWFLLFAGMLLLGLDTVLSTRLSLGA